MRQRKGAKAGGTSPAPAPAPPTPQRPGHGELPPTPALRFGLAVLLGVRLLGAATLMITDCDETFNYWEPAHYTLYGWGFQTWEYSPAYALRSYLFLLPHSCVLRLLHAALGSKIAAFYGARAAQAALCWHLERRFCEAAALRYGEASAHATLWLLAGSAGMFHAAPAFLPSSFTMLAVLGIWSAWLRGQYGPAIVGAVYTILLVWPFAVLLYVPLGLAALLAPEFGLGRVLLWGCGATVVLGGASVAYDGAFYGRCGATPSPMICTTHKRPCEKLTGDCASSGRCCRRGRSSATMSSSRTAGRSCTASSPPRSTPSTRCSTSTAPHCSRR